MAQAEHLLSMKTRACGLHSVTYLHSENATPSGSVTETEPCRVPATPLAQWSGSLRVEQGRATEEALHEPHAATSALRLTCPPPPRHLHSMEHHRRHKRRRS